MEGGAPLQQGSSAAVVEGLGVGGEGGQTQVRGALEDGLSPWAAAFTCGMAGINSQQLMLEEVDQKCVRY